MGKPKVLGIGAPRFAKPEFEELQKVADVYWFKPEVSEQVVKEVARLCKEQGPFDAAYVLFGTAKYSPFTQEMLGPLFPGCGLFASGGAGYDDVPTAWLEEHGCYAANTPHAVTNATADMSVFLALAALRDASNTEANCRAGKWRDGLELTQDPDGKTLGIFGMGAIGKSVAKKLQAFGMKVVYHNRRQLPAEEEAKLDVAHVSEEELLKQSDVLSLHCPLTEGTKGWLNAERIAKMKDGAFVVNTARGAVIDEEAIIQALESGKLARLGADVFVNERMGFPLANPNPWFLKSNKVICHPHWAAFTEGTILKGERQVMGNVRAFLEKGCPLYPVNDPKPKA